MIIDLPLFINWFLLDKVCFDIIPFVESDILILYEFHCSSFFKYGIKYVWLFHANYSVRFGESSSSMMVDS